MKRTFGTGVLGAAMLAALGGCAYQDPLALPDLAPQAQSSMPSPYYGYGFNYGYGSGYRPGYDPYYNYYYGGTNSRYYGPGVVYVPYPVPCADANHDGRCDKRPRGDGHGGDGHGRDDDGNHHDDQNGGKHDRPRQWPNARDGGGPQGDGPRVRPPAPAPRTTIAPPAPRPPQARPQETPRRAAPPPPSDRGPRVTPSPSPPPAPTDGSPPRRPD
jgi:hypothetical protein